MHNLRDAVHHSTIAHWRRLLNSNRCKQISSRLSDVFQMSEDVTLKTTQKKRVSDQKKVSLAKTNTSGPLRLKTDIDLRLNATGIDVV